MNREEHFFIGFVLLILSYFILNYLGFLKFFGYAVTLLIGSVLPDVIEPAKDYTHRDYFHSRRFLKILYYGLIVTFIIGLISNQIFYIFFLIIGYIFHLFLDSTTKMGLPK